MEFTDKVLVHNLHWVGGSRNTYRFVRADGQTAFLQTISPWDCPWEGKKMDLPPEILVVERVWFCGKDLGIRIYAHPSWAPKLLPAG